MDHSNGFTNGFHPIPEDEQNGFHHDGAIGNEYNGHTNGWHNGSGKNQNLNNYFNFHIYL